MANIDAIEVHREQPTEASQTSNHFFDGLRKSIGKEITFVVIAGTEYYIATQLANMHEPMLAIASLPAAFITEAVARTKMYSEEFNLIPTINRAVVHAGVIVILAATAFTGNLVSQVQSAEATRIASITPTITAIPTETMIPSATPTEIPTNTPEPTNTMQPTSTAIPPTMDPMDHAIYTGDQTKAVHVVQTVHERIEEEKQQSKTEGRVEGGALGVLGGLAIGEFLRRLLKRR